jgi:dsRNA-specific ribonuclease
METSVKMRDKPFTDVGEAPIGADVLDKGLDRAAKMVSPTPTSEHHPRQTFSDDYISLVDDEEEDDQDEVMGDQDVDVDADEDDDHNGDEAPAYPADQQKLADDIEAQFGYKFKSPTLLMLAFTPPQKSSPEFPSNRNLKYLGMSL